MNAMAQKWMAMPAVRSIAGFGALIVGLLLLKAGAMLVI
jgi:hypothetical protein